MAFYSLYDKQLENVFNLKKTLDFKITHMISFGKAQLTKKEKKTTRSALKNFFYELTRNRLIAIFEKTEKRWKRTTDITHTPDLINCTRKLTRKLLLIASRIKLTALTARGNIRWEIFWTYTVKSSRILLKSYKSLGSNWLSKNMNAIKANMNTRALDMMEDPEKYNKLSVTYILLSTCSKSSYIGESKQGYNRFKAETACGKNAHLTHDSPSYKVKLARYMNKIGYNNFVLYPIQIFEGHSMIERKRAETFFIRTLHPNLNRKIFKTNTFNHVRNRRPRPLQKWREKMKRIEFCTCAYTSGYTCGPNCWLEYEWKQQRRRTTLATYKVTQSVKKSKTGTQSYIGTCLDIILRKFKTGNRILIQSNEHRADLTDLTLLQQDFGKSMIPALEATFSEAIKTTGLYNLDDIMINIERSTDINEDIIANLSKLATTPHKWKSILRKCTQDTLFNLYYRADTIQNKTIRTKTRYRLATYIFSRFGISNISNLTCPFGPDTHIE